MPNHPSTPSPAKQRRRRLTERQVLQVLIAQGTWIYCYRCGESMGLNDVRKAEREHVLPLALGGADFLENMRFSHKKCHDEQTEKDKAQIAKADRQLLKHETGRSSRSKPKKIHNRGFDKRLKRKISGEVVAR